MLHCKNILTKGKKMLTLEQIRERLKDRRLYMVAKEIGVSYPTLLAISRGESKNPSYRIIQLICDYLERK